jgi:ADP-ribosylglycohydrolase
MRKNLNHQNISTAEQLINALKNTRNLIYTLHKEITTEFLGWTADDAIAASVYCTFSFPNNPYLAVLLGVHTPGDSDSIASMTGALAGALYGYTNIPDTIKADLERIEDYRDLKSFGNQLATAKIKQ